EALAIVRAVGDYCGLFKVGMQLHNSAGFGVTEAIMALGYPVFLDLKFHDIPHTVLQAAAVVSRKGVRMFTVHATGGREMLAGAVAGANQAKGATGEGPLVLAVTILTSVSQTVLNAEIGLPGTVAENVVRLAAVAQAAGVGGVVASPQEIRPLKQRFGQELVVVTPGVRPVWAAGNDQARVMTPGEAIRAGADYLVVGRPVTAARDKAGAARRIEEEMARALAAPIK
ncbi:MAG: orotidine-5'-phosphate decarboxylase, partial [Heliobacteriaceae bacterium]|nr:orotidine-5'-phosphate decarboxylase [Heliobacteriaceae bacterium]